MKPLGCSLLLLLLSAGLVGAGNPSSPNSAPAGVTAAPVVDIPQSVFVIPSSPKEGRNPFFPLSTVAAPPPKVTTASFDVAWLSLNGLTSPPKRTAIINGYTFEPGEEHEIRIPGGGKEAVKCLDIKSDRAIINVRGQTRELRLRQGL